MTRPPRPTPRSLARAERRVKDDLASGSLAFLIALVVAWALNGWLA